VSSLQVDLHLSYEHSVAINALETLMIDVYPI